MKIVHTILIIILMILTLLSLSSCDTASVAAIDIVNDTTPEVTPENLPIMFGLNGEEEVSVDLGCDYKDSGAYCLYGETDISMYIKSTDNIDTSKPGKYTVYYTLVYKGERYNARRFINVIDKISPKIELKGEKTITLYTNEIYKEPGYIANDNYDGDLTDSVTVKTEKISDLETKLIYIVADSSGNEYRDERFIQYKIPDSKDLIYLTFDDGPHKKITPQILDILKEYDIKATFFMLNFDDSLIQLVHRIVEEGHSIAIHGNIHYYKDIYKSEEAYLENLKLMQDRLKEVTGITTNLTRFPFGSHNTISNFNPGIMEKLRKRVPDEGYIYYDWNVSTGDGVATTTSENMVKYYKEGLKRGRNNIVLMHDSWGHENTVAALPEIIKYGIENGFTFGVITECTPPLY